MKVFNSFILVFLCATLAACSTWKFGNGADNNGTAVAANGQETTLGTNTQPGVAIGGSLGQSMDAFDRVKLSRSLDKSPGKSTSWVNEGTGVNYTVTPLKKVTVNGNPFCRQYQTVATKGGQSQSMTGTACVAADGAWSEVRG